MRKVLVLAIVVCMFEACNGSSNQGGVVNDGTRTLDSNGGLADTAYKVDANLRKTDTSKMEDRVDLSKRDTFNH